MPEVLSFVPRGERSAVTRPGYRQGLKPPNAGGKFPAEVLSYEEAERLIGACSRRGKTGVRQAAMYRLMLSCGFRVEEVCDLELRDVDLRERTALVRHGKGNKRRQLGMNAAAADAVERWLSVRRALAVPQRSGPLFCTISKDVIGRRVDPSNVRDHIKRMGKRAGIDKRVHPHGLRHTFAVNMRREGRDLLVIMRALGHNDLATTQRYIDHLYPGEVIGAMQTHAGGLPAAAGFTDEQLAVLRELIHGAALPS